MGRDAYEMNDGELKKFKTLLRGDSGDFAVSLARSILSLRAERDEALDAVARYMPYERLYRESIQQSIDHSAAMMGNVLRAALDPESALNRRGQSDQ